MCRKFSECKRAKHRNEISGNVSCGNLVINKKVQENTSCIRSDLTSDSFECEA